MKLRPLTLTIFLYMIRASTFAQQDFSAYVKKVSQNCNLYSVNKDIVNVSGTGADGAQLSGTFLYGLPATITAVIKTSWGQITENYCYEKGQMVYVFVREEKEMPDPYSDGTKLTTNFTTGYYFFKGQPVYEENVLGKRQPVGKKEMRPPLTESAQQYAELLKSQLGQ